MNITDSNQSIPRVDSTSTLASRALETHRVVQALHALVAAEPQKGFLHITSGGYRLHRLEHSVERIFGVARPDVGWIVVAVDKEGNGRRPVFCFHYSLARFVQRLKAHGLTSSDFSVVGWDDRLDQYYSIRLDPTARIHISG